MVSIRVELFINLTIIVSTFLVSAVSAQECKHPLPILMKTASGVDITKLDFLPIDGPSSSHNRYDGFVENVFNFTCSGAKWRDVDGSNDTTEYDIPDTLNDSLVVSKPWDNFARYSIALNELDIRKLKKSALPELEPWEHPIILFKMLFTQNRKDQSLSKQYFESGKMFSQISKESQSVEFWSGWSALSHNFDDSVAKLPNMYWKNPEIYQQFVQRFGTHFIKSGRFSFLHYLQFAHNRQYAIEHTDDQILRNLKVAFYREFNDIYKNYGQMVDEDDTIKNGKIDEEFSKNSELIVSFGGNTLKWVDKISGKTFLADSNNSDRVLLSAKLHDLDELIGNWDVKDAVKIAIRVYKTKAYLNQLANVYNYTNYQLSKEDKASLVQVETMLKANVTVNFIVNENLDKIEKIVDQLYDKVSVFADKKFCYPTLYDLYVTANLKLNFAQTFCEYSAAKFFRGYNRKCVSYDTVHEQQKVNNLLSSYENGEQDLHCVKAVRELNREYNILNDRDNGLRVDCVACD